MPRRRQSNVDGTLRSKASSDFPKPSSANPNPIKPGRRSDIVKMKHQKEEIKAIKQQKEEIKAIEHPKKAEQLLTSVSTDTPNDIEEEFTIEDLLPEPLRFESSLPKFPYTWPRPDDYSDPDPSVPRPPLSLFLGRPVHPIPHGRLSLPSDFIDVCEVCGANHWTYSCSYFGEMPLDAKIDESEFDIICSHCCKAIANGACPVRCSPPRFKVRHKPFLRPDFAPTNHLSKDLYTAYGVKCFPPQQVPTSFSGKQKEASVSTKTPNTIEDLSAPPGSNSSSQERKTYPLAFYDLEARWRAARERIMPYYSP